MNKLNDFKEGRIIPINTIYIEDINKLLVNISALQNQIFATKETIIHTDIIIAMSSVLYKAEKELLKTKNSDLLYRGKFG